MGLKSHMDLLCFFAKSVKIRPRWDWNSPRYLSLPLSQEALKSDQDGIEINTRTGIHREGDALKSDQDGIEICSIAPIFFCSGCVKIRPRWDWNHPYPLPFHRKKRVKIRPRWDWNTTIGGKEIGFGKVKIRPRWDWNFFHHLPHAKDTIPVKIRPRWDWNLKSFLRYVWCGCVKIRPRWDWNHAT